MKPLLLSPCCLVAVSVLLLGGNAEAARLNWNTGVTSFADEQEFRDKLDAANLDEKIKDELFFSYVDYNAASTKLKELMELNGLNKPKPAPKSISADVTDPTIKAIRAQVNKTHNRFEFLKKTINKWGPSTNLTARAAGASLQHKLNAARNEAKSLKDMQKAARKFGKKFEKVRKNFEKYRDKAATDDERAFWQSLLDIIPVPNI